MPQLDSNAFLIQYLGVVVLLTCLYTLLSYVVLPLLLNLQIIRLGTVRRSTSKTELSIVITHIYQPLVTSNTTNIISLINIVSEQFARMATASYCLTRTLRLLVNLDNLQILNFSSERASFISSWRIYLLLFWVSYLGVLISELEGW